MFGYLEPGIHGMREKEITMPAELKFTPFMNNTVPESTVLSSHEGMFTPMSDDGRYPVQAFSYTGWLDEELSWYDTCYIHGGLNPAMNYLVHGAEYLDFLTAMSVNTFKKFPVGKARHVIICQPNGKVMNDGIVMRLGDDTFYSMFLPDPGMLNEQFFQGKYHFDVEDCSESHFFYQMCGPRSLEVVEQATQTDLHDLGFMWIRQGLTIAGHEVFVLRTGMAGTLGYEIHGLTKDCLDVLNKVLEVGEPYGIRQLGKLPYVTCHCEGSIPQGTEHFAFPIPGVEWNISGSLPADSDLVYRTPMENGWQKMVRMDHDFVGKEAIERELAGNYRTACTLIWDVESICDAVRASMDGSRRVDPIELPCDFDYVRGNGTLHIDSVYVGDTFVGCSSGRMFSSKTRQMISIGTIDHELVQEGTEVEILWGNKGTDQVRIKARVSLFPYIKEGRNESFDTETIPHPEF